MTFRAHQANGRAVDMTFVRHPYRDPGHFPELELILDAVAEVPPRDGTNAPLPPTVQLLPETLLVREPLEVMGELLGHPKRNAESASSDVSVGERGPLQGE